MLEKLKDWILEKEVRSMFKKYYAQLGITLEEAERVNMYQLLKKIEEHLETQKQKETITEKPKVIYAEDLIKKDIKKNIDIAMEKQIEKIDVKASEYSNVSQKIKDVVKVKLPGENIEKMTDVQLLKRLETFLNDAEKQNTYMVSVISHQEEVIAKMTIQMNEQKEILKQMKIENKALKMESASLEENNYKLKLENSIYKQKFIPDKEKTKEPVLEIAK